MTSEKKTSKVDNTYCSVPQCKSKGSKNPELSFHRFPTNKVVRNCDITQKKKWINRRDQWILLLRIGKTVSSTMVVCSKHFNADDYKTPPHKSKRPRLKPTAVPSLFLPVSLSSAVNLAKEVEKKKAASKRLARYDEIKRNTPSKVTEEGSKMLGLTEIKVEPSELVSEQNEFTKTDTETCGGALSDDDDELMNVKLELYEAFTDISNLRKENEMLTKNLSTTEAAQNTLQKSVSERQKELMITRLKLQQAYREVTALQNAKEELLEKLRDEDIVQNTLEDPDQLHFYTGLNSMKDFTYILSLISSVDGHFRSISLKKQLLVVLMKLKLNLYLKDLAYRFKISATLVGRICDYMIPFLLAKVELLLKCPINAALRRNIPDSVKNTVYENLYQRLVNYTKSKTKPPEEEEGGTDFEKMDEKCILN